MPSKHETANLDDQLLEYMIESPEEQKGPKSFPIEYLRSITNGFNIEKNCLVKEGFAEVFLGTTKCNGYKVAIRNLKIVTGKRRDEYAAEIPMIDLMTLHSKSTLYSHGNQTTMSLPDARLILDLPTEVMQNGVFQYLSCTDICSLSEIGNERLKDISEDHLKRTCGACSFFNTLHRHRHPNIMYIYGYSNDNPEEPCLIYPGELIYPKSENLDKHLKKTKNPLTSRQRLKISVGIANAVKYIHSQTRIKNDKIQALVHRDIRPSNILLDVELQPKLIGFDLLKFESDSNAGIIPASERDVQNCCGTIGYMSPESIIEGIVSAKGDVWSFGVVLLMIITGLAVSGHDEGHLIEEVEARYSTGPNADPILNILHPCWENEAMTEAGRGLYKVVTDRCLIRPAIERANIGEVVADINKIMTINKLS
jgi:serine/threonine protein kinase